MNGKRGVIAVIILGILLLTILSLANALAQEKEITKEEASEALAEARLNINEMKTANFSIALVNDTLFNAEQIFIAQTSLEEKNKTADYSLVIVKTEEIRKTKEKAFELWDEILALENMIGEKEESNDMTEAYELFNETKEEFFNERYLKAEELIEITHEKINEIEAFGSKVRAIYSATIFNLSHFITENWPYLIGFVVLLIIYRILFWNTTIILILKRKRENLENEKRILENLVKKTQFQYFQLGKLPESVYYIRTKKFSELIRDINRQIPLIIEQIESRRKSKKTKKLPRIKELKEGIEEIREKEKELKIPEPIEPIKMPEIPKPSKRLDIWKEFKVPVTKWRKLKIPKAKKSKEIKIKTIKPLVVKKEKKEKKKKKGGKELNKEKIKAEKRRKEKKKINWLKIILIILMLILFIILIIGFLFAPFKRIVGLLLLSSYIFVFFGYPYLYEKIMEMLSSTIFLIFLCLKSKTKINKHKFFK